jgi:hypothetical protein
VKHLSQHWPLYVILACSLALGLAMYSHQDPKRKTLRPERQVEEERRQLERDFLQMHAPPTHARPATTRGG